MGCPTPALLRRNGGYVAQNASWLQPDSITVSFQRKIIKDSSRDITFCGQLSELFSVRF